MPFLQNEEQLVRSIPSRLEIYPVLDDLNRQFPGIFLFSTPSRFLRPVRFLPTDQLEFIGSLEQVRSRLIYLFSSITYDDTEEEEEVEEDDDDDEEWRPTSVRGGSCSCVFASLGLAASQT